ncbi:MAG: GspH/FimT family pseudopilin [Amphritea sp.]
MKIPMWEAGSRPASHKGGKHAGFTLLELLVVLVIATLILGVVTPRLFAVMPGVELKTSTQKLAAMLRYARGLAISRSRVVTVEYDDELPALRVTGKVQTYHWPESVQLTLQAGEEQLQSQPLPELQQEKAAAIRFYPDGSSSGGALLVASDSGEYQISVHWLTGKVTINE